MCDSDNDRFDLRDALERIRTFLQDPKHWTQGVMARAPWGWPVDYDSWIAEKRCLLGTVCWASKDDELRWRVIHHLRNDPLLNAVETASLSRWNDRSTTTHQSVLDLLDRAIERLQTGTSP